MNKKSAIILIILPLIFVLPYLDVQGITLPVYDNIGDVEKYVEGIPAGTGTYGGEIDIQKLYFEVNSVVVEFGGPPSVSASDYLYRINITWGFNGHHANYTTIVLDTVGGNYLNIVYSKFFNATDHLITVGADANAITTDGNKLIGLINVSNLIVDPNNPVSFTIYTTRFTIEDARTCMYKDELDDTTAITTGPPTGPTSESPEPTDTANGWTIAVAMAAIIATTATSIIKHKKRVN